MNPQEREQLTGFLQQLSQAQATQKDNEADTLIREACLRQPDAAYLLVQRAMLLGHAVQDTQTQITRLQAELAQAQARSSNSGFLDPNAWGSAGSVRSVLAAQAPAPYPASPTPAAAPAAPASAWGSGMLGNIATTAAGVVAGGFLFQGIGHLMGNQASHAASPGTANGLSSNADTPTSTPRIEQHADTSGVFDTSSVDSFINDDAGGSDDIG